MTPTEALAPLVLDPSAPGADALLLAVLARP
jgi:hypothetical protein